MDSSSTSARDWLFHTYDAIKNFFKKDQKSYIEDTIKVKEKRERRKRYFDAH